jgi:hypothetical protein
VNRFDNNLNYGIAVGHAPHLFKIDTLADIHGITPTDLGYRIAKYNFLIHHKNENIQSQIED